MNCLFCQSEFNALHKDAKFCSKKCWTHWGVQQKRNMAAKPCIQCNVVFVPHYYESDRQKFCSDFCKDENHKTKKRIINLNQLLCHDRARNCNYCKNDFLIDCGRNLKEQKFCCNKCKSEWHKQKSKQESEAIRLSTFRNCPICEKQFTPAKSLKQTYCSKRCCYLFPKKCYGMLDRCLGQIGTDKQDHAHKILGFTPLELQAHIQSHPNWNDIKDNDWHVDHIFPIIAFIEHGIKDIKLMCCLDNLQPLKSKDNLHKNKMYDKQKFIEWLRD